MLSCVSDVKAMILCIASIAAGCLASGGAAISHCGTAAASTWNSFIGSVSPV